MIVDLDELDLRELFESQHQRARDSIKRSIRLALPNQIDIHAAIRKLNFTIACKTVIDDCQSLIPFHIAGTLEKFIERRNYNAPGGGNETRHSHLVRKFA